MTESWSLLSASGCRPQPCDFSWEPGDGSYRLMTPEQFEHSRVCTRIRRTPLSSRGIRSHQVQTHALNASRMLSNIMMLDTRFGFCIMLYHY